MLRKIKASIFVNLILVILMSSSICQTIYTSLFMTYRLSVTIFIAVIILTLIFFVMFKSKVSAIVSAIVVCLLLIIGLVYILFNTGIANAQNLLTNYSTWFIDAVNGFNDKSFYLYNNFTLISLAFIITLFVYMFSIKFYNFYVITIMLFSVFFVQLQFQIFTSDISFILFIFSFLLYYFIDTLRRRSKASTFDVGNNLKYLLYIIPICVVVITFSFSFPIKSDRSALPWLDTRADNLIERVTDYFSNKDLSDFDYFSIEATGFGSNDRLGGNIKLNKTHVMDVKSEYSNLYLKATSKAFYDGHNWYDDNKQLIPIGNDAIIYSDTIDSDSSEFTDGIARISKINDYNVFYKDSKVEIKFVKLKTKSIFVPVKSTVLRFNSPISLFFDNEQMISADKIQKNSFEYTFNYNNLMLNNEEFKNVIRKSNKGFYNNYIGRVKKTINNISKSTDNSIQTKEILASEMETLNKLNSKVDTIYRKYTQLPEIVTPRVRQLAQELTKASDNPYDKAKAIENYLSKNYLYTLTPGNPPRKKDFVDYFLFDGKKGYCTYYASAMTIMLRCIDIPARYVEGYILPPKTDDNGVFNVTNQQAHAWVEVYFEGFGWIPFEPTAPFVANMYNDRTISANISSDMLNSEYNDYMVMMERYRNKGSGFSYEGDGLNSDTESNSKNLLLIIIIIASVIGCILLAFGLLVLINMFKFYRILRRIRKGDPKTSVLFAYNYIIKVLRIQNVVFKPGETPSQFGIRVEKTYDFMGYSFTKTSFIKITNLYIKARYSEAALLKTDQQDILDFIEILISLTIEKVGKIKFVLARYVFGKI
jgi:hypothetical protein